MYIQGAVFYLGRPCFDSRVDFLVIGRSTGLVTKVLNHFTTALQIVLLIVL